MIGINDFLESIEQLNNENSKAAILMYCTEFDSLLRKTQYTEEEKELIEKFAAEGLYKKIVDEYIQDSEIRTKILSIRFQYKNKLKEKDESLGKIYAKQKMFSDLRDAIFEKLKVEITPENIDERIGLFNDLVCNVLDPLSADRVIAEAEKLNKHMTVESFQETRFHKYMITEIQKELKKGEKIDPSRKARIDEYTTNYIDFLRENGQEIDFENDELLKVFSLEDREKFKNNMIKKENISRRISEKDFSDGNERENILEFCSDFFELLQKQKYTNKEKELIEKFAAEGLYKKIVDEYIQDSEIRTKILSIRFQYKNKLKEKDESLGKIYAKQKMFSDLRDAIFEKLKVEITPENIDERIGLFNDLVCNVLDPLSADRVIAEAEKLNKHMTVESFQETRFHKYMITEIQKELKKGEKIDPSRKARIDEYTTNYIDFLRENGQEIDFENDELLKVFSPEDKEKFKESNRIKNILLREDTAENVEKKDLLKILDTIEQVLERSSFSYTEKQLLRNYVKKGFFESTIKAEFSDKEIRERLFKIRTEYRSDMIHKDRESFDLYNEKNLDDVLAEEIIKYSDNLEDPSKLELDAINRIANNIINKSFSAHKFGPQEKKFINFYFEKYFQKSVQDVENVFSIETTLRSLIKMQRYNVFNSKKILGNHTDEIKSISGLLKEKIIPENCKDISSNNYEKILKLIAYQDVGNIDILRIGLDELQRRGHKDIYNSEPVKEYIETFVKFYSPEGKDKVTIPNKEQVFSFIYEYVNELTSRENFNLFDSQGISDILQLIAAQRIPKENAKQITKIISENLKIDKIDKDTAFKMATKFCEDRTQIQEDGSKKVETIVDEKEFDEFLKSVQQLKLSNKLMISNKIAHFIIHQTFDENSVVRKNPQKYQGVIERTLEDISFNDIDTKMSQTNKRKRCFFVRDVVTSPSSDNNNASNNKYGFMRLSRELVKDFIENQNLKVFETIFHENTHTEQNHKSTKRNSHIRYLIEKEDIIRAENPEFYKANYRYMYCEIEAREEGARKLAKFVKEMGLDLTKGYTLEKMLKEDILSACRQRIRAEKENYQIATNKHEKIGDTKKVKVTEYFDELMLKKGEGILKKHPSLKMEYNEDGTLKSPIEYVTTAPSEIGRNLLALYRNVLSKGNIFKASNLERDLTDLMQVTKGENVNKLLASFAIIDNVGRMVDEVDSQIENMPLERLVSLDKVFNQTNEYIESEENKTFCVAMQKRPKGRGKTAQTKMNETHKKIQEKLKEYSKEEIEAVYEKLHRDDFSDKKEPTAIKLETINVDGNTSQINKSSEEMER